CVEQDIDLADAPSEGVDIGRVANVEPCRLGDTLLGERRDALFVDVGGNNRGTLARKCDGACASDARRRCGDNGTFALETVSHVVLLISFRFAPALSQSSLRTQGPIQR